MRSAGSCVWGSHTRPNRDFTMSQSRTARRWTCSHITESDAVSYYHCRTPTGHLSGYTQTVCG